MASEIFHNCNNDDIAKYEVYKMLVQQILKEKQEEIDEPRIKLETKRELKTKEIE